MIIYNLLCKCQYLFRRSKNSKISKISVCQYFSSDPCQLKSTTARSVNEVNDVIEIPDKKTDTPKVLTANMDAFTAATIEEDAEEMEDAPKQKTIRRGGVSAEAVQEEDFGTFEKKVGIENTMQCLKTRRLLLVNKMT